MQTSDLNYSISGMFTTFYPNTPAGENAWRTLASSADGTGKIFTAHLKPTLRQLRAAGYSVAKSQIVGDDEDIVSAIADELSA